MKCQKCLRKSIINIPYLPKLCQKCFARIVEKRLRKYTRINRLFKKDDNVIAVGDLPIYFMKQLSKDLPLNIKIAKTIPKPKKGWKIVIPWTLDDENNQFLENLFLKKKIENPKAK